MFTCVKNAVDLEERDESFYDCTGLIHASREGHKIIVDLLTDLKVNIEAKDMDQWTALIWASIYGRLEIVEKLIQRGANVNYRTSNGWCAFICACMNK